MQSVSSSFTWAITLPPPDIEVSAAVSALLGIESRFDLLPRLFRTPVVLQESLPAAPNAVASPDVQGESNMRGAAESVDPVLIREEDKESMSGATTGNIDKNTSSSATALDSDFLVNDIVEEEEEEELVEAFESHKEEDQESELNLQGLGGGAVVVGCSADTDTVDMLRALSQSLKTSIVKASDSFVSCL